MESITGVTDNVRGDSHDPIGADDGAIFWPFKHFPGEIRTMIWMAAAANAKPRGVYQFRYMAIRLAADRSQLARSIFTNIRRLKDDSSALRDIRRLVQGIRDGDCVSTFTPLTAVGEFTREIRDLLRSCPEARSELMRDPEYGSSFNFHWMNGGMCDLGVVRPFRYDADWISFSGLKHLPGREILPPAPSVLCTPDIAAIQHLAIPFWEGRATQVRGLSVFPSLRSLGMYEPSFCIKRVSHWDRLITQEEKLFLKGVSTLVPSTASGKYMTCHRLSLAMVSLKHLIQEVAVQDIIKKLQNRHSASPNLPGLNFCFLLHANSQAGLELMKFKEDGSHLHELAQIEELGALGREVKASRINGSKASF